MRTFLLDRVMPPAFVGGMRLWLRMLRESIRDYRRNRFDPLPSESAPRLIDEWGSAFDVWECGRGEFIDCGPSRDSRRATP